MRYVAALGGHLEVKASEDETATVLYDDADSAEPAGV